MGYFWQDQRVSRQGVRKDSLYPYETFRSFFFNSAYGGTPSLSCNYIFHIFSSFAQRDILSRLSCFRTFRSLLRFQSVPVAVTLKNVYPRLGTTCFPHDASQLF